MSDIQIKIELFAIYQEVFQAEELELTFPPQTTVSKVLEYLVRQQPSLAKWQKLTRFGVNLQFVPEDWVLQDGDELVLIPPVSGG